MKQRVYLETTIPSYLTSRPSRDLIVAGHQEVTRECWETSRHKFEIFISQFVIDESSLGDHILAQERIQRLKRVISQEEFLIQGYSLRKLPPMPHRWLMPLPQ